MFSQKDLMVFTFVFLASCQLAVATKEKFRKGVQSVTKSPCRAAWQNFRKENAQALKQIKQRKEKKASPRYIKDLSCKENSMGVVVSFLTTYQLNENNCTVNNVEVKPVKKLKLATESNKKTRFVFSPLSHTTISSIQGRSLSNDFQD